MSTLELNATRLREICADRGITSDQAIAETIGMNKGTVSRVLHGQAPGPKFISAVLSTIPVKFEDVFDVVDTEAAAASRTTARKAA